MTEQITVPRATWDTMREALNWGVSYIEAMPVNTFDEAKQWATISRAALLESHAAMPAKQVMQIPDSYGPLDANALERVAKENPDQYFLKGSGGLKLIAEIREFEQKATPAAMPVGELREKIKTIGGLVDCGECRTQGCPAGSCLNAK